MAWLTQRDLRLLLDTVQQLYHLVDLNGFRMGAITALSHVVPADLTVYSEINLRRRQNVIVTDPAEVFSNGDLQIWARHIHQHPICQYMGRSQDGSARKLSDFLNQRQFHRLALYQECYRLVRIEQQIAVRLDAPAPVVIALSAHRHRPDFSERDRLLLNLLRPPMLQARYSVEALTQLRHEAALRGVAMEALDRGVIALTQKGSVLLMTAQAQRWVEQYCGAFPRHAARLPRNLWQWVVQQQRTASISNGEIPLPVSPLVLQREGKRLVVRLLSGGSAEQLLLLLEEQTELQPAMLAPLGLTKRESEILYWVMRGKTNVQISEILGLSPLTVRLRLEHIFKKLEVTSRLAATTCALERLGMLKS
jgi:DNA-binding CsgD family transcriptional regulator